MTIKLSVEGDNWQEVQEALNAITIPKPTKSEGVRGKRDVFTRPNDVEPVIDDGPEVVEAMTKGERPIFGEGSATKALLDKREEKHTVIDLDIDGVAFDAAVHQTKKTTRGAWKKKPKRAAKVEPVAPVTVVAPVAVATPPATEHVPVGMTPIQPIAPVTPVAPVAPVVAVAPVAPVVVAPVVAVAPVVPVVEPEPPAATDTMANPGPSDVIKLYISIDAKTEGKSSPELDAIAQAHGLVNIIDCATKPELHKSIYAAMLAL